MSAPKDAAPTVDAVEASKKQTTPANVATAAPAGNGTALDAALAYAALGWHVFPCKADKKPLTRHGFKDATTDPEQIRRWWRRLPNAQIGVACGASSIYVIDLDLSETKNGSEAYVEMHPVDATGDGCTLVATTPRGGEHRFFAMPAGGATGGTGWNGVDVRAKGEYVIVPSPASPGRGWLDGTPGDALAPVPSWFVPPPASEPRPDTPKPAPRDTAPRAYIDNPGDDVARARYVLDHVLPNPDDLGYEVWLRLVAALCSLGDEGVALAEAWSRRGPKHKPDDIAKRVGGFNGSIGIGTLFDAADKAAPGWRVNYRAQAPELPDRFAGERSTKEQPPPAARYPVSSWLDVAAMPPGEWTIEGWVPEKSVGMFFGESGLGKSFLAIDMSARMACGMPWFGNDVVPGGSLYFAGEGHNGLRGRLAAWLSQNDVQPVHAFDIVDGLPPLAANSWATYVSLIDGYIKRHGEAPSLVWVDTFACGLEGDENAAESVTAALRLMSDLRRDYGCSVWAIHHPRKAKPGETTGRLSIHDLRGHGALRGNTDGVIGVEQVATGRQIVALKVKEGQDGSTIAYDLLPVETGRNRRNGNPETSCIVIPSAPIVEMAPEDHVEAERQRRVATLDDMEERAVEALRRLGEAPNVTTVCAEMTGKREYRFAAFNRAVAKGRIRDIGTARAPRFVVPDDDDGSPVRVCVEKEAKRGGEPGTGVPVPPSSPGSQEPTGTDGNREPIDGPDAGQPAKSKGRKRKARKAGAA